MTKQELACKLYDIGAVKFGTFTLKSGMQSPIYIDLRLLVSHPEVLAEVGRCIWDLVEHKDATHVCGVPTAGIPIATAIALHNNHPMIMVRKAVKDHGTAQKIEGTYKAGDTCCVIDDLVTSGKSVFESSATLEDAGIMVQEVAVLIDRQQGGRERIEQKGYKFHAVFTMNELLSTLQSAGKIDADQYNTVTTYVKTNQVQAQL